MKKFGGIVVCLMVLAVSAWAQGTDPIQIKYEAGSASGYFGGDYQTDSTSRNVANGVAITLSEDILVSKFAFNFRDFDNDETGDPSEVTLVYAIRNAAGKLMKAEEVTMADTFTGGWIHWEDINVSVTAPGPAIFTCYVKDGESNYVSGGANGDSDAGDDSAVRYTCTKTEAPFNMLDWDSYGEHSWDAQYWLQARPLMGTPPLPITYMYQVGQGGGWFGGDYRAGNNARNVGTCASVTIDTHMILEEFSLSFDNFRSDSTGTATLPTLVFTLRDTDGSELKSEEVAVPSGFDGGWVTWESIMQPVNAPGPVIVSCYVKDGHTNYIRGTSNCDGDAGDENAERYTCTESSDPYDMDDWENWGGPHSWDVHYKLVGRASVEGVGDLLSGSQGAVDLTVSPNPFIQTVTISLKNAGTVDYVSIQDLQGKEIRRLDGGVESIVWDGTDANGVRVQPGAYVGIMVSDGNSIRTGIILSN